MSNIGNLQKHLFRMRIDEIQRAYEATIASFSAEIAAAELEGLELDDDLQSGRVEWEEYAEDGTGVGHGRFEMLTARIAVAHDAKYVVRKAFVLLLYHQWERSAYRWLQMPFGCLSNHDQIVSKVIGKGIPVNAKDLGSLRHIVNCIKHNSTTSGEFLYKKRPFLFRETFKYESKMPNIEGKNRVVDWQFHIMLEDEDMTALFLAVRSSAPV